MGRISKYENVVLCILNDRVSARNDDYVLYYYFLEAEGFSTCMSLEDYLLGDSLYYPKFETIARVRRKLQEKYPELRPTKNEQIRREEAEKDFRAYARGEENG